MKKLRVAVFFGGKSAERDISKISAAYILKNLDRKKYTVTPIELDAKGRWSAKALAAVFGGKFDVAFPVLHGPMGEDGTIQGFFEIAGLAYVGCGVLASALCMDKEAALRLVSAAGVPVLPYITFHAALWEKSKRQAASQVGMELGYPVFVKPVRLGSSIGISKVKKAQDLEAACIQALQYDTRILIQKAINAREIELAVLGDATEDAFVSIPGEIIPNHEFYSYEAKYIDPKGADLKIPAPLDPREQRAVQAFARQSFATLGCEGMARMDFLMDKDSGSLYFNEANTIPGFTSISMYPKLMEASGLSTPKLLDKLIAMAIKRAEARAKLSQAHPTYVKRS